MKQMKLLTSLFSAVILLSISTIFSSCSSDDEAVPAGEFASGVFVVNEGNFLESDGSITHFNTNNSTATQAIFSSTNNGSILGDIVQSMTISNDLAYIVVNNSNKIEVANANSFEAAYTISDVLLPRYMTTFNGKGYITEWVSFTDPGRVSVIDLETRAIETTIETGFGAEFILEVNGLLYVSNSFTNTISVINPSSNEVVETIELSGSVTQMVVDQNQNIWAISAGTTDYSVTPPVANNDGKILKIDPLTNTVTATIELNANVGGKLATNSAGSDLFIIKGASIFKIPVNGFSGGLEALVNEGNATGFYSIGVDPATNIIYAGDARGFQGNGKIYRYQPDGTFIDSFDSGRGPNGFIFQ